MPAFPDKVDPDNADMIHLCIKIKHGIDTILAAIGGQMFKIRTAPVIEN